MNYNMPTTAGEKLKKFLQKHAQAHGL
jgi:hypothetical protein